MAVTQNMELEKIDAKTMFLHEKFKKVIYMKQPEDFVEQGNEDHVYVLNRSLYRVSNNLYPFQVITQTMVEAV